MALNISRVRALCFDVDGTLSDTDDQFVLKLARWLKPIRFLLPRKDEYACARRVVMMTETPGNWLFGLPDRLGIDDKVAYLGNAMYSMGLGRTPEPFLLVPGVRETLETLRTRYPLSIVSARDQRSTTRFLEQFDLGQLYHCIATAQTCRHTKPYPDPIFWTAKQMGVLPEDCLMIGDTVVDILAGKAAGAQTVGVLCGFGEEKELRQAGADLILASTAELENALA
jgi:phosphoglycolate phosphatase-like HAD superfamily hydrolase